MAHHAPVIPQISPGGGRERSNSCGQLASELELSDAKSSPFKGSTPYITMAVAVGVVSYMIAQTDWAADKNLKIEIALLAMAVMVVILAFKLRSRQSERSSLEKELVDARRRLKELEQLQRGVISELSEIGDGDDAGKPGALRRALRECMEGGKGKDKPVRIFMEGAFDLMHYGHMNAFRLGSTLGTELVVGVNSAKTIAECKGPPVMSDEERITAVGGCRFVAEVIPDVPYVMTREYLMDVMERYKIDYVVHGDDPVIVNGVDIYAHVKKMGKYKSIPRTEGVSTTDIVGRMLLCSREHHVATSDEGRDFQRSSRFYTTSSLLRSFTSNIKPKPANSKVVYCIGAWDMFHAGDIELLQAARQFGNWVVVGIFNDAVVNNMAGRNYPILNLNERVLSVLGCHHVDDVLIDAPTSIDQAMMASLDISKVVISSTMAEGLKECCAYAEAAGKLEVVTPKSALTVETIVERIQQNRDRYEKKFSAKKKKEDKYYDQRYKKDGAPGSSAD